jgi:hypothetical protein
MELIMMELVLLVIQHQQGQQDVEEERELETILQLLVE